MTNNISKLRHPSVAFSVWTDSCNQYADYTPELSKVMDRVMYDVMEIQESDDYKFRRMSLQWRKLQSFDCYVRRAKYKANWK